MEDYRSVPNAPVASPPNALDADEDPHVWTCPMCGAQETRKYGTPPQACWSCGQRPADRPQGDDWGESA